MGIFNKKSISLKEKGNRIAETYFTDEKERNVFLKIWEELLKNNNFNGDDVDFCEKLVKVIQKNHCYTFYDSWQVSRKLCSLVVSSRDDEMQKDLFFSLLDIVLSKQLSLDKAVSLLGIFSNRQLLLNFLTHAETYGGDANELNNEDKALDFQAFNQVVKYMLRARQYYVDENAFLLSSNNLLGKLMSLTYDPYGLEGSDDHIEDIIEDQIHMDIQLAGIYDISQEDAARTSAELTRINNSVKDIDSNIKKFEQELNGFSERLENLDGLAEEKRLEILNAIEDCWQGFLRQKDEILNEIGTAGDRYLSLIKEKAIANPIVVQPNVIVGTNDNQSNEQVSNQTVMLFNSHLSLEKRLDIIKEKMQGGLYHKCFISAIKQLLINKSLYLAGPGGSGKTNVVYQMAEILGLNVYNLGFVADEFTAFKGYMDANGNFVKTPFYTAFKYGGIVFLDEIDNSDSKALIELNKFVNNKGYKPYLFPNGELVYPHPNFRLVAAGNTWGDGADYAYSTREKLDNSTLRRFAQIYCGFDNNLERQMFDCNDDEMYEFAMFFRDALDIRDGDEDFSTGDLEDVNIYLKTGIYSAEEILELKFIKNRRIETLQNILDYIDTNIPDNQYSGLFQDKINNKSCSNVKRKNRTGQ